MTNNDFKRGYFGIGIYQTKNILNIGTLWRTAFSMGASFIFAIGKRYKHQASDVNKSYKHIPFYQYESFEEFKKTIPKDCPLIAVELDDKAKLLTEFKHPERAIYLLGAEDSGLPDSILSVCHGIVEIPNCKYCLNVSVAGSIVIYDRIAKTNDKA